MHLDYTEEEGARRKRHLSESPKILTKVPGWLQPLGTELPLTLETNKNFYKSLLIAAFRYLYKRGALSTGLLICNRDLGTSPGTEDLEAREERQPNKKIVKGFLYWPAP